jgi:hypothetical protein
MVVRIARIVGVARVIRVEGVGAIKERKARIRSVAAE